MKAKEIEHQTREFDLTQAHETKLKTLVSSEHSKAAQKLHSKVEQTAQQSVKEKRALTNANQKSISEMKAKVRHLHQEIEQINQVCSVADLFGLITFSNFDHRKQRMIRVH